MNNFLQIIKTRRSIRQFLPRKVAIKAARQIIESARFAPSAHNSQPWRFIAFENSRLKERLAAHMGKAFRKDLEADKVAPPVIARKLQDSRERVMASPLCILVCLYDEDCRTYPDTRRNQFEMQMAHQGIGAAIQNMLLTAHALGLGACWLSAPLFCPEAVRKAFKIPKGWVPVALIAIGHSGGKPKKASRHSLRKISRTLE
jgi:coenzyme F420-0:L-glutamate ligase / coenzyme F420-1:gamma-L-glutamate ligase